MMAGTANTPLKRINPEHVCKRYRELRLPVSPGSLGVIDINGTFQVRHPFIGVCGLGVLAIGRSVPPGASGLQDAVNRCLGLDWFYAWGFYDGFAGWGAPTVLDDAPPEALSSYVVGHADGVRTWRSCDPVLRARESIKRAAALIRERGWTRGTPENRGRYAVDGAIRVSVCGTTREVTLDPNYDVAVCLVESYLSRRHRIPNITVSFWNDNICVSSEEAISVLERIAKGETCPDE